jgi:murein DD-endopeptidase MepM/ murein hydrolase activator NlpD
VASNRERYESVARAAAIRHGINPDTYVNQIQQESEFDPNAYNKSGASGIAQIIPQYHPDVNPWNPEEALDYAAQWMRSLIDQFGSYVYALAAYNWGPGNVGGYTKRNGQVVQPWDGKRGTLPKETQHYLDVILGQGWSEPNRRDTPVAKYIFPIVGYNGPVNTHWDTGERGGSDLFASIGSQVVAMCGGRVSYAGNDKVGGINVVIDGDDGLTYYYAHLDDRNTNRANVRTGQVVPTGTLLGGVGDSGNARGKGAHLHIGIGYGISTGSGAKGGCGLNYDAVGLLQRVLSIGEGDVDEMDQQRIAELEQENADLRAQLEELKPKYDELDSWSSGVTDIMVGAADALREARENDKWTPVHEVEDEIRRNFQR